MSRGTVGRWLAAAGPPLAVLVVGIAALELCVRLFHVRQFLLPAPSKVEGKSFSPLLRDPAQSWDKVGRTVINRPNGLGKTICDERYRYTKWPGENVVELYDHQTDPGENTNLAKDPKYADIRAAMEKRLNERK